MLNFFRDLLVFCFKFWRPNHLFSNSKNIVVKKLSQPHLNLNFCHKEPQDNIQCYLNNNINIKDNINNKYNNQTKQEQKSKKINNQTYELKIIGLWPHHN